MVEFKQLGRFSPSIESPDFINILMIKLFISFLHLFKIMFLNGLLNSIDLSCSQFLQLIKKVFIFINIFLTKYNAR